MSVKTGVDASEAVRLVGTIKDAIQAASDALAEKHLRIAKAELELMVHAQANLGLEFKLGGFEAKGGATDDSEHTLTISLVPQKPRPGARAIIPSLRDDLVNATCVIAEVAEQAAATLPPFELDEATVALNITVTEEGRVALIFSGGGRRQRASTVTLTITRPLDEVPSPDGRADWPRTTTTEPWG